jgi:hypothetical protein
MQQKSSLKKVKWNCFDFETAHIAVTLKVRKGTTSKLIKSIVQRCVTIALLLLPAGLYYVEKVLFGSHLSMLGFLDPQVLHDFTWIPLLLMGETAVDRRFGNYFTYLAVWAIVHL